MSQHSVVLDCYTVEPSGLGVPPSCTGWRTLPILAELTRRTSRPVVSSVSAMAGYSAHLVQGAIP
ncbi:hypothetical protein [Streptomyces achromogenes]|uniref:hypothetical protein n=1 Tax=Streptomyces achromogenes TaxID=67255 RepID=UPI0036C0EA43